jgi:hypothetical protein
MNTMVDRPIFAFEPSFLDRLPHQYDRNLDPTNVIMETSNDDDETRDDEDRMEINESDDNQDEFLKRPIPQRVPTTASSRVASAGSVNTAGSNSRWFLRNKQQHSQRASKRSTSGSSQFGGPSVNSVFSIPTASMNSFNSLGSLSSLNSFLKGMNSVDSIKGFGASMDSLGIFDGTISEDYDATRGPSTGIIRQVTPEEYRGHNRYHDSTTSVMRTSTTTTSTSFSHHSLYPDAPTASPKSAATLINLYSQANKKESKTINTTTTTVKQPSVPNFLDGTGASATTIATSKAAAPSASTKAKSKRVAAKKSTKSKSSSAATQPKKRIRRKEPVVRKYVIANEKDVLLGRGGGSNHHPGNIAYRQEILRLQPEYKLLDRDAKTAMSEQVVQWVLKEKQGRFLKRECKASPWYIVTDATARQKVSQALREDHTPEGRALKKSRTTYKTPKKSKKKN